MQNVEVIEKSVKLVKEMLTVNKKLRVNVLETNYLNETRIFIIVGFNLIGKVLFIDNDGIDETIKVLETIDYKDPDYSVAEMCYEAPESIGVDNWCFEVGDKTLFKKMKINQPKRVHFEEYKKRLNTEVVGTTGPQSNLIEVPQTPINEKDLLEQKVVIHENNPVTNTVSLARDFNILNTNVMRGIVDIVTAYPYLLNQIHVGFHETGKDINKHYVIQEPVYVKFLELLPKDRSENPFKRIQLRDAYYTAFSKMREWFYEQEFKPEEVKYIMEHGKETTSLLITRLEIKFNEARIKKPTQDKLQQSLFNHINFQLGLDSISYKESNNNREHMDEQKAKELKWMERVIVNAVMGATWSLHTVGKLNLYISEIVPFKTPIDFEDWQKETHYRSNDFKKWTFRNPYRINDGHALKVYDELMTF